MIIDKITNNWFYLILCKIILQYLILCKKKEEYFEQENNIKYWVLYCEK